MSTSDRTNLQFWDYIRIILGHGWVVALCVVVVCLAVWITSRKRPTLYEANGQLEIRPTINSKQNLTNRDYRTIQHREFNTLLKLINSPAVGKKVLVAMEDDLKLALFGKTLGVPDQVVSMVTTKREPNTNLVRLSARAQDAVAVARFINLLMEVYAEYAETRHMTKAASKRSKLQVRREQLTKKVRRGAKAIDEYLGSHPDAKDFLAHQKTYQEVARRLDGAITQLDIDILKLKPGYRDVEDAKTLKQKLALDVVRRDERYQENRQKVREQREELDRLTKKGFGPEQKDVKRIQLSITAYQREFTDLVPRICREAQRRYENMLEARTSLAKKLGEKREDHRLRMLEHQEFQKLTKASVRYEGDLKGVQVNINKTFIIGQVDTVTIIDSAEIPTQPVSQQAGITYLFAVMFGLIGGIGMALLMEYLDDTVKNEEDILNRLDLPMLGFVPYIRGDEDDPEIRHVVTHHQPKSAVSEAFRAIRTKLVFSLQKLIGDSERGAVVAVTSSQPREGKTTVSSNLAITMAHSGTRVLLLDADLRKPRVHKSFKLRSDMGLTNYLAGVSTPSEIIQDTGVKNLWAIPSGPLPPNPYELLGSQRMRRLLTDLRDHYDVLIFDTPPLIFVPDASVLAGEVDGVVHVISAYVTRRKLVQMGKDRVASIGGTLLGAVLNNVDPSKTDYYYYYYYYPGYYRYYSRYYRPEDEQAQGAVQSAELLPPPSS